MRYPYLALLLIACGSDDPAGPNAPPVVADGVAVDTFIVMRHTSGIHIVDPATGKASASQPLYYSSPVSAIDDGFAISPDGQHIAWVRELGSVVVGVAKVVDGEPVLEVIKEYPDVTTQGVKWSPDGDRLVTTFAVIDPATDDIKTCPDDDPAGDPVVLNETLPFFPGGYRYICPDGLNLYDDGAFVGHAGYGDTIQTADGQLYGLDVHQLSAARREDELVTDITWNRGDIPHLRLPDGKTLVPPGGGVADDGYVYDLPAIYTSRVWARSPADRWLMIEALDPFLHEGDAASIQALTLQDNGRAVVFRVTTQVVTGFPPEYVESDMSVVEVTREGVSRGFITSPLMEDESFVRLTTQVYDLVGDDWLVAGWTPKDNGQEPHLVGYVDGRETHFRGFDTLTPDGRWLYGFRRYATNPNEGGQHCFYDRKGGKATCFPQLSQGTPIGLMGGGVKPAHDGEAPAVTGVSRTAAWPGAEVVVFGAHFGTSGTLTLGGVEVETTSWTANQIRFRMPMSPISPAGGVVAVSNGNGTSGYREFHVGLSALITTPFSGMTTSEISVGQGINMLDLGDVALEDSGFVPVGDEYAYLSSGASPAASGDFTLHAGGATRSIRIHAEDRSADPSLWQPVAEHPIADGAGPRLADIAGLMVETQQGRVARLQGERAIIEGVDPRIFFGGGNERGVPDFWRNVPEGDAAWTASRFAENSNNPWSLRFLENWESTLFGWRPVYAAAPRMNLPTETRGVAALGQTVLTVGRGANGGSYQISTDGAATFVSFDAPTPTVLREPLLVETATPFFLVLAVEYAGPGVAFHTIALDGTFTSDVLSPLPEPTLSQDPVFRSSLQPAQHEGKVALWFSSTQTLQLADFNGTPSWTTLPSVRSIYQNGADLYAVMLDGTVQRSSDWKTFAPFDLGFSLAVPTTVVPYTITKLESDAGAPRWLVIAKLFEGTEPSRLGRSAFLVGPEAP